ncbi:MAG: tRNA 2-selenouridine(34) synthase MnmH [Chitinophagaceae bacterium]|nr:tRNA 2-selenouridine(34) synthase MnmH [Chitinophagaceae bacterium]
MGYTTFATQSTPSMPAKIVTLKSLLNPDIDRVILDVRSPAEYEKAHVPGALNLPLFSDEERAIVGTAYKQESPEKAMLLGLEFAGKKMRQYVEDAALMAPAKKILVHCWRGGKRSESMAWLLSMAGFDVEVLKGGYKQYRQAVQKIFHTHLKKLIVIGGQTGIGKTYILHQLAMLGEQIIDLEKWANHKGSAFGSLGQEAQPSTEMFENLLFEHIRKLDAHRRIFIENESKKVGICVLPDELYRQMKQYYYIQYTIPFEDRLDILVQNYAAYPVEDLKERFKRIERKLGGDHLALAFQALDARDFKTAAAIALKFYDKTYLHGFENNTTPHKLVIDYHHADTTLIAMDIQHTCNTLNI